MEYNLMAGDIIATLDSLNIKSFHMVGHSLGGKVAGATSLKYSDRVKSLVFLDISPIKYDKTSEVFKEVIHTVDFLVSSKSKISESSSKKEVQELISK
jgi:esterase